MVRGKNKYCIIKFLIPILLIIKRTKIENINNNMKINEFFIKEKLLISIESDGYPLPKIKLIFVINY